MKTQLDLTNWAYKNFSLSIVTSGAVFGWLFASNSIEIGAQSTAVVAIVPAMVTGFLGITSFFAFRRTRLIGDYLEKIEQRYRDEQIPGWHVFLDNRRRLIDLPVALACSWIVLFVFDLTIAALASTGALDTGTSERRLAAPALINSAKPATSPSAPRSPFTAPVGQRARSKSASRIL